MCKHAAKKLPAEIRYVPDQCKTQQMRNKAILWNSGMLDPVRDWYKTQEMCDKAVDDYAYALEFVPNCFKTQKMCNKAVNTYLFTNFFPEYYKTQEMFFVFHSVTDRHTGNL